VRLPGGDEPRASAALAGGRRIKVILYEQAEVVRQAGREQPEGDVG
jgi:hypothetical protein